MSDLWTTPAIEDLLSALDEERNDPATFRRMYMQEWEPSAEDAPAASHFVFAPTFRMANTILSVDHRIDPRLDAIRISTKPDFFHGLKAGAPVMVIDPRNEIRPNDSYHFSEVFNGRRYRDWNEGDFKYLRWLTDNGGKRRRAGY